MPPFAPQILAHRGNGYLFLWFFCFVLFLNWLLAHRGLGYLLIFFFLNFLPIRASDTCSDFFFSGPSGPRIPALIFFFHRPSGPFMDENVLVLWVVALSGISTLFAADRLVVCE